MINTAKLRKRQNRRKLQKLAIIADKLDDGKLIDKQDEMLRGLDDGWNGIRNAIIKLSAEDGEWAGYPLPIEHAKLVIEPRHKLYSTLNGASTAKDSGAEVPHEKDNEKVLNHWRDRRGWHIFVVQNETTGKSSSAVFPFNLATARAKMTLETIGASQAWSVDAEFTAMARLKTLVTPAAFRYYILTGTFLETSKRSNVVYLFRKLRPTLAFVPFGRGVDDIRLLTALCLHPIGYYEGTFAGSMVPTDDVIAHLTMMRGDERKFWSKCNQHEPEMPESGI